MNKPASSVARETVQPEHVAAAIEHAHVWRFRIDDKGAINYMPFAELARQRAVQKTWLADIPPGGFSREEMSLVDSRLADVLDAETAKRQQKNKATKSDNNIIMSGENLRYNQHHWKSPLMTLPPEAFSSHSSVASTQFIGDLSFRLNLVEGSNGCEALFAGYDTCVFDSAGESAYISAHRYVRQQLNIAWMNQHYPGWRNALVATELVDLQGEQRRRLIFVSAEHSHAGSGAALQGVQFE